MVLNWIVFLACALAIALGCLLPKRWLPANLPNDKLMHFACFGLLGLLALPLAANRWQGAATLLALLAASLGVECLQQLVPERAFCWRDMAANAAGLASAGLIALLYVTMCTV